ncbi:TPA: hypothetical protein HA244_05900 [Candidatus Micrarchaeota archaeon]|nr:hypothetical protein [Candidatus Micrarchaeota archaeon]
MGIRSSSISGLVYSEHSLRSDIIRVLSERWPLNARHLYSAIRQDFPNVTYQGVHKALRLLVEERVVTLQDMKYALSLDWIREMRLTSESIERRYTGNVEPLSYIRAGTGASHDADPSKAGRKAAEEAVRELAKPPDFAFVFCHGATYGKDDESINALVSAVNHVLKGKNPRCRWVGCTTDGEISDKGCFFNSCSVLALASDHVSFGVGVEDGASKDFFTAGKSAAEAATKDLKMLDPYLERYMRFLAVKRKQPSELLKTKPYLLITLFPGPTQKYQPNEEEMLKGIQNATGLSPLFGGSSSDSAMFRQTYQFANGRAYKDSCIVVTVLSDLKIAFSITHGLKPTRKQALASKSRGNRVFTLDGKPAAKVYAKMLGMSMHELRTKLFDEVVQRPYGIADPLGHYWIKTPFHVNPDLSLSFLNNVPQNSLLVLMDSDDKSILASTKRVLSDVKGQLGPDIPVVLLFDCGSRPRALRLKNREPGSEFQVFKKELPESKIIGFYTHGEQALIPSGTIGQHNQTIVAIGISKELISE